MVRCRSDPGSTASPWRALASARSRARDQRHLDRVPPGVGLPELGVRWGVVAGRGDVLAAREHEALDAVEHGARRLGVEDRRYDRSEEHTSELQSPYDIVCRLLLEKKKNNTSIVSLSKNKKTTHKKTNA